MYLIKTAKTVEEAVNEALIELGKNESEVEVEIIEEPSKGFFGLIGSKEATVKVTVIQDAKDIVKEIFQEKKEREKSQESETSDDLEEEIEEKIEVLENEIEREEEDEEAKIDSVVFGFLNKVLSNLGIEYEVEIERVDNFLNINILGDEEKLGIVIGKRGVTLDSIQYLLSLLVNKVSQTYIRVIVDASGYRKKRENTLVELAERMADKVVKSGRSIRLEPMNAAERRIIHSALQSFEGVSTHSEGKDPYRKVVIQKEREY
ncbi:protein jag [Peptoniphilus sp. GNH]|nr:protein jag [Peptoniphilus sp. GNH]